MPVGKTGWSKSSKSKFVDVAITISLVKDELELQDLVAKEHERELQRQWGLKPPTAVPSFAVGDKCRLHSLRGRPELNGRVGTIQKLLSDRGRWKISLHPVQLPGAVTAPAATAQSMAVKSANLLPAHAPFVASCELTSELLEHAKDDPYCKGCANRCCTVIQRCLLTTTMPSSYTTMTGLLQRKLHERKKEQDPCCGAAGAAFRGNYG